MEIGTRVRHSGYGTGTIVRRNQSPIDSFYSGLRYPYVVRFDNGFVEVYGRAELRAIDKGNAA